MRPIRPTRRIKKRHILVKFLLGRPRSPGKWAIEKVRRVLGELGLAASFVRVEIEGEKLVLSVAREWADIVSGALVLGEESFIPVTYIGGTLDSLRRKGLL